MSFQSVDATNKTAMDPVFKNRQSDLRNQAAAQAEAVSAGTPRPWQIPRGFTGDLLDIANLHKPDFDRTTLNADYKKCMDPQTPAGVPAGIPATVADIISVQLQIARVAAEERAFRSRHGSLVRHMAHAGARRQGLNDSLAIDGLVKQVERILLAGNLEPPPGANV